MNGMIKRLDNDDIDIVMDIWLKTSISAHRFISQEYWLSNYVVVKEEYLPHAETFIYEDDDIIKAFISVMKNYYVGALFVSEEYHGQGVGRELIDYCKNKYPRLELNVYKDNTSAVRFYEKCGFNTLAEQLNEDSLFPEYVMVWKK